MPIRGCITNNGLKKTIEVAQNEGWVIIPKKFALSSSKGVLEPTRTILDLEVVWYENWISGRDVKSYDSLIFLCYVPPEQAAEIREVNEIYIIAEDPEGNDFLLYVAQPDEAIPYDPSGTLRLRIGLTITNLDLNANYQFVYTQAVEIESHNADPNAHPDVISRFISMGYPINSLDHLFTGQLLDEVTGFHEDVTDQKLVYYDITNKKYMLALADGTERERVIGISFQDRSQVISGGYVKTNFSDVPYSFPNDMVMYLSSTTPGEPTLDRTNVPIGVHIADGLCYIPPAPGIAKYAGIGGTGGLAGSAFYVSSDIEAKPNDNILADTTGNPITITLPVNARVGDSVKITDAKYYANVNNITVDGQGALINGATDNLIIDVSKAVVLLSYESTGNNWIIDFGGSRFAGYID